MVSSCCSGPGAGLSCSQQTRGRARHQLGGEAKRPGAERLLGTLLARSKDLPDLGASGSSLLEPLHLGNLLAVLRTQVGFAADREEGLL